MALSYNDFEKQKTNKSKLSYDAFSSSQKKSTEPSFLSKALSFGKEIVLDTKKNVVDKPLTNIVQGVQAASKLPEILKTGKATFTPMTPFNYKGTPVQPLGTRTADNGFTKENVKKDLLDIGGTGLEMASFLGFGPSAKAGFQATEQLVKGATKKAGQTLLKSSAEGAFGAFTGNIGQQMQDNASTGKVFNPMETAKATATGAVFAPALNVLSRGLGNIFGGKKIEEVAAETIAPKLTKEERYAQYLSSQGYEPITNPNKLPEIKLGPKAKPSIPTIEYGKTQPNVTTPNVASQIQPKVQIPTSNIINSPEDVDKVLSGIMREGKSAPELVQQAVKESIPVEQVIPQPISREVFTKADDIVETLPDSNIMTPFERQKNVEQVASILQRPQDEIIDIVKGNKELPDNIPRDAYFAVAKNIADETNDAQLALDLLPYKKEISSKTGQGLQATQIAKKDNIVDILDDVQTARYEKLNKDAKLRYSKDLDEAVQIVQREFEKIKGLPNTREQMVEALSKLIC